VFEYKVRRNLDPYFRAVYIMQCIAVLAMVAGLFLVWWNGSESGLTALDILNQSTKELRARHPSVIGQPLMVLWALLPCILVGGLRAITGVMVTPVWYRRLALVAWVLALLALAHFYINYGNELYKHSPLKDGEIGIGFWLTTSSTVIVGLLILSEYVIREPDRTWIVQGPAEGPVHDAERLWRGEYITCPHCGMLNELDAKACYNCKNLLFSFRDEA